MAPVVTLSDLGAEPGRHLAMILNRPLRQLARTFLTGLLAALPLLATVGVFVWLVRLLYGWLGPHSFVGQLFVGLGLGLGGSELLGYVLGLLFFAAAVFALGVLVQAELQRGLEAAVNALISRIPGKVKEAHIHERQRAEPLPQALHQQRGGIRAHIVQVLTWQRLQEEMRRAARPGTYLEDTQASSAIRPASEVGNRGCQQTIVEG